MAASADSGQPSTDSQKLFGGHFETVAENAVAPEKPAVAVKAVAGEAVVAVEDFAVVPNCTVAVVVEKLAAVEADAASVGQ